MLRGPWRTHDSRAPFAGVGQSPEPFIPRLRSSPGKVEARAAERAPRSKRKSRRGRGLSEHARALRRRSNLAPPGSRSRKCRGPTRWVRGSGRWSAVLRHVGRHVTERLAQGNLEPPASVAEAVSSLTIADAFVAAGEGAAPPPQAPPRSFICSFPSCSAAYNKAWKLDAHLCRHTGEVTGLRPPGAWRAGLRPGAAKAAAHSLGQGRIEDADTSF